MQNRDTSPTRLGLGPDVAEDRPLTKRPTIVVERTVRRWLFCAVVPLVVVVLGLHEFAARRQSQRSQNAAADLLGQAVASQWRTDDVPSVSSLQRACQKLISQPAILAVAVLNPQGETLAQAVRDNQLLPILSAGTTTLASTDTPEILSSPENRSDEFPLIQRVNVPLGPQFGRDRPARLTLLVGEIDPVGIGPARGWFGGIVLAVAAFGFFMADMALRRRVIQPVSRLLISASTRRLDLELGDVDDTLDEFDALARALNELKEEAFHWRGQAERVERRMALQIASQTREISRDLRRFQREVWIDPLTRLKNRRLLDEQLPTIFAAHRDANLDLSLVMLDLDHFKRLNDEHGHQAGDEVLIFVGELLRQCLRTDDIAVRYGGDEFVLILPGISAEDAAVLAKRLMALFSQRVKVMLDGRTTVGMSAGVASLANNRPASHNNLLAAADQALYLAKKSGRGCVRIGHPCERKSA